MHYSDSTLRLVRNHFGFSQADLAQYLGVDRSQLTHVEADRRSLPMAATWRLLPLLSLMPPPHGTAPAEPLSPDPAETTAASRQALARRLAACQHEARNLVYNLEVQLPRLQAARHRRTLPARLAVLPLREPLPGLPDEPAMPNLAWAARMAENAGPDLAKFGVQARALSEARLVGLRTEIAYLEKTLGITSEA